MKNLPRNEQEKKLSEFNLFILLRHDDDDLERISFVNDERFRENTSRGISARQMCK